MATTVLDSTDLDGILADAGVTLDEPKEAPKDDPKPEAKVDGKLAEVQDDPDDIEGEDGLTPRQKRDLTANMQKAIGKKHRMLREAEEFAAAQYSERKLAEQRAAQLERELAETKGRAAPVEEKPAPEKPQRQNFHSEEAYVDAMIQFGVDQRLAEKAKEDQEAREQRDRQERINAAGKRVDRARELVPDFDEVVGAIDTPVPPEIARYMESAEMMAELAYHFAKNPDVLLSLAKLTPHQQLVKVGKIESTLSPFEPKAAQHDDTSSNATSDGKAAKAAPSTDTGIDLSKPRSKPAPVITPLDGSGSAGASKDSKDMNIRESIEDFAKRNRVNLGARKRH